MSDDPIRPDRGPPPEGTPRSQPGDPYDAAFGQQRDPKAAKGRLMVPGILIILVGLLNLVPGFGCVAIGLSMSKLPDAELEKAAQQYDAKGWEDAKKQGYTVQSLKDIYLYGGLGCGGGSLLFALLSLIGGTCMIAGRSMFLCVIGALSAMLSPGGFGLLGLAVGIWALVVLLSEDVRAAFRAG
jgi:hypothetical protein